MAYFPLGTAHWESSIFSWVPYILWKNYEQKLECTAYVMRCMVHCVFVKWLQHHSFWVHCSTVTPSLLCCLESSWNVMAHGYARGGKWRGNWRMEWVASTLHTTSEHGVSSITTADEHTSAASSWLNWCLRWFKWTHPFRRKTKSGFCTCAITFQTQSTHYTDTVCCVWVDVRLFCAHMFCIMWIPKGTHLPSFVGSQKLKKKFKKKQDRQCTYNVTLRCICSTTVAVEEQ
jgi:hypothetical protein